MATIDKAAIVWTIAIVAFGAGVAIAGDSLQSSSTPAATTAPPMRDTTPMMDPEPMMEQPAAPRGPQTVTVTIPAGTSTPGCEVADRCYVPSSVSINTGDTVSWDNVDTVAHTVTSGTPENGVDGIFDSSLLLGGNTYEVTFDSAGSYDYFCIVHPWMVGDVQVS